MMRHTSAYHHEWVTWFTLAVEGKIENREEERQEQMLVASIVCSHLARNSGERRQSHILHVDLSHNDS